MYALHIEDFDTMRISSISYKNEFTDPNDISVDNKPEGECGDYRWVNNEYLYDPLPKDESQTIVESVDLKQEVADIKTTLQTHDDEINTIVVGLESLING